MDNEQEEDNLVIFPKINPRTDMSSVPITQNELEEKLRTISIGYYDLISDQILDTLIHQLSILGFALTSETKEKENYLKSLAFLREVIVGIMCHSDQLEHPIHDVIDDKYENFKTKDEETGATHHTYGFKKKADE
jgi:hypothetical protein